MEFVRQKTFDHEDEHNFNKNKNKSDFEFLNNNKIDQNLSKNNLNISPKTSDSINVGSKLD